MRASLSFRGSFHEAVWPSVLAAPPAASVPLPRGTRPQAAWSLRSGVHTGPSAEGQLAILWPAGATMQKEIMVTKCQRTLCAICLGSRPLSLCSICELRSVHPSSRYISISSRPSSGQEAQPLVPGTVLTQQRGKNPHCYSWAA